MDRTLVLASANPHKVEELRQLLNELGVTLRSSADYPDMHEVIEDRETLEGNAIKKATEVHEHAGLPAIADDTGLEVDALGGRPGVYSARYAGEEATYEDNVEKLLSELKEVAPAHRTARFRTVIAFRDGDHTRTFEGVCEGKIIDEPRGEGGFGYDPVFVPEGFDETFAELSSKAKNEISHRGRAIQKILAYIKSEL